MMDKEVRIARGTVEAVPQEPAPVTEKGSFEQTHKIEPLSLVGIVVNDGQSSAIGRILVDARASVFFTCHGHGTSTNDFYDVFGLGNPNKQVLMSLIRDETWARIRQKLVDRFAYSEWSKGIAFLIPIDSLMGVSAYKFLTDSRIVAAEPKRRKRLMSKEKNLTENTPVPEIQKDDDYELVVAIVNSGFTDLVMDAAKKAGARGGTLLNAKGTGNKEMEKFFGVVITPEKQIVLILVPRAIKDDVVSRIYHEAGMNTKGQGICFAIPASDVVGVVKGDSQPLEGAGEVNAK